MLLPWSGFYEFLPTEEEGKTKPLHVISSEKLRRFFFHLLQDYQDM